MSWLSDRWNDVKGTASAATSAVGNTVSSAARATARVADAAWDSTTGAVSDAANWTADTTSHVYVTSKEAVEGAVEDAAVWTSDNVFTDDHWFGRNIMNNAADAGDVYHEDGLGTYARIYAWEGVIKGSVGETAAGIVQLPDIVSELAFDKSLYDDGVGDFVADNLWYDKLGGRYEAQSENQAKLLGTGQLVGDAASIFVAPAAIAKVGRGARLGQTFDLSGKAAKAFFAADVASTGLLGPMSVPAEVDRYHARLGAEGLDQVLHALGADPADLQNADSLEAKTELADRLSTEMLINAGYESSELEKMDLNAKMRAVSEIIEIINALGADSPARENGQDQETPTDRQGALPQGDWIEGPRLKLTFNGETLAKPEPDVAGVIGPVPGAPGAPGAAA